MKELIGHIESLLLTNDCVIVPDFGGFIAFNVPAKWMEEQKKFLPPMRTVGFNPQLKLNDGLVVQAYMSAYGTNFPDASKRVRKAARELKQYLISNGIIELQGLGTLRVAMDGSCHFVPFIDGLNSPALYGLGELDLLSFTMERVVSREIPDHKEPVQRVSPVQPEEQPEIIPEPARSKALGWRIAVASAAAVALFLSLSTPVGNVEEVTHHRAQVVTPGLFTKSPQKDPVMDLENKAVVLPAVEALDSISGKENKEEQERSGQTVASSTISSPVESEKPQFDSKERTGNTDPYYVVVGAFSKETIAEETAGALRKEGYPKACVISSPRIHKVCIASYANEEKAIQSLRKFREGKYEDAWIFKNK